MLIPDYALSRHAVATLTGPLFCPRGRVHGWQRATPIVQRGRVIVLTPRAEREVQTAMGARLWEAWHAAGHRGPIDGPAFLRLEAVFAPPKSDPKRSGWASVKPDDDNIGKTVRDAMQRDALGRVRPKGYEGAWGLLDDDAKVVLSSCSKRWASDGLGARLIVRFGEVANGA